MSSDHSSTADFKQSSISSIRKLKNTNSVTKKRYRIPVKISNSHSRKAINGLLDTSRKVDTITLKACQKLSIAHRIDTSKRTSSKLGCFGEVKASILVGDITYRTVFEVRDELYKHDIIIGSSFLQSDGFVERVSSA